MFIVLEEATHATREEKYSLISPAVKLSSYNKDLSGKIRPQCKSGADAMGVTNHF